MDDARIRDLPDVRGRRQEAGEVEWWSGGVVEWWRVECGVVEWWSDGVVLTAYIRVFGGAREFAQDFRGRVAKQHRWRSQQLVACSRSSNILEWREKKWERCQEIEQQRHICPDVREWREAYCERGMPGNRGDQRLSGSGELQCEPAWGEWTEQMRQRRKRGAIRDNRRRWNAPKCGRLAVRESEIRHGEFCVD